MPTRSTSATRDATIRDTYLSLIRRYPLRPIGSEESLDQAIAMANSLLDREDLDPDEEGYLDVLGDLIHKYEQSEHPIPALSDAEMLRHLIEMKETTQAKVSEATGIATSTVSEILAGKRGLNRKHIAALARFFAVSPAIFLSTD